MYETIHGLMMEAVAITGKGYVDTLGDVVYDQFGHTEIALCTDEDIITALMDFTGRGGPRE